MGNQVLLDWPPYTCVACFVFKSLQAFGIKIDQMTIAKEIKTKVPPNIRNPFKLETTDNKLEWGLSRSNALVTINIFLNKKTSYLRFKHIYLNTIPFQMHEDVTTELLERQLQVGIGYDFSDIDNKAGLNKHVSFIKK